MVNDEKHPCTCERRSIVAVVGAGHSLLDHDDRSSARMVPYCPIEVVRAPRVILMRPVVLRDRVWSRPHLTLETA
jgi:hypothetical protein